MRKMIVTDLDGTLLNKNGKCDEVINEGVKKIVDSRNEFVVASGRTVYGVKECTELWENPIYLILMNGALILDKQRNIVKIQNLSKALLHELFELSAIFPIDFYSENKTYTTLSKEEYITTYSKWDLFQRRVTIENEREFFERFVFSASIEEITQTTILKVNIFNLGTQDQIKDKLSNSALKDLNVIYSNPIIEITSEKADKLSAVQYLVEELHIDNRNVFVFGDSENDIEMLSNFENSYAPQNAKKQILDIVSEVVLPNYEYGVLRKIKQLCEL